MDSGAGRVCLLQGTAGDSWVVSTTPELELLDLKVNCISFPFSFLLPLLVTCCKSQECVLLLGQVSKVGIAVRAPCGDGAHILLGSVKETTKSVFLKQIQSI